MRSAATITRPRAKGAAILSALLILTLLTGCAGSDARLDLARSRANGTIERTSQVTAQELYQIITRHFGRVNVKFIDSTYLLLDNGKVVELSEDAIQSPDSNELTRGARWDCDDYAIAAMVPLRNFAFGAMYIKTEGGTRHAINVFVNVKREVVYWEPQTKDYYRGRFHKPDLIVF